MNIFLSATISLVGLGVGFATILAIAHRRLKVEEDPKVEKIEGALPGLNCGACGFPNCRLMAEALANGTVSPTNACPVGGEPTAQAVADILDIEVGELTKRTAIVHCGAHASQRTKKARYSGIQTCSGANMIFGAECACAFGCLGYGDCARACPFDAIVMVDGLPQVDPHTCTACGRCVAACPRRIISLQPFYNGSVLFVACSSGEKGAVVKKICPVGCIACKVCEKLSEGALTVTENLARVNADLLANNKVDWNTLIEKCPTHTIQIMKNK
jgi:RnfABCDGE-type electron transport complex B subunit